MNLTLPAGPLYFVHSLTLGSGAVDFRGGVVCQMFVIGKRAARLVFTDGKSPFFGNVVHGIATAQRTKLLTAIEYSIAGVSNASACLVVQAFRHPFKHAVRIMGDLILAQNKRDLFEVHPLNFLLGSTHKEFANLKAVQFTDK